jgi:crotonobetainyl-CoA:carnitine CoA-transferase CaiB-like acyl-CoA transferase
VKVESSTRPDGARKGNRDLFERLHAGHEQRTIPFESPEGRAELRRVLADADVVIEGSRPRALDRLGIDPAEVVTARPGAVWLSITAYGRSGPWRDRVGFGDDCAAAGGLVTWTADGSPAFVGDAVADPLTGMVSAALVARAVGAGGGIVLDVALREVARTAALGVEPSW